MSDDSWQETSSIWHRVTDDQNSEIPDVDTTVLVYDAELDDVVMAAISDDSRIVFSDIFTDQELPKPTWWTHVPWPWFESNKQETV